MGTPPGGEEFDTFFFHSMREVGRKVSKSMGWERERELQELIRLWQETFGNPVARVSYPLSLSGTGLVVACESALWKRELTYLLPELRSRLAEISPSLDGKTISFRVVRPFSHPLARRSPAAGLSPDQIEALWRRAAEIASVLPEPLRDRGRAFVFRQMANGIHLETPPGKGA